MNNLVRFLALTGVVFAFGCSTTSTWNASSAVCQENQLAPDVFSVSLRNAPLSTSGAAREFALLKAADVVQKHGFSWFSILSENNSPSLEETKAQGGTLNSGSIQTQGGGAYFTGHTTYIPGRIYGFSSLDATLLVRGFHSKPADLSSFEVATVQQSSRQGHSLK